jgi:hypothetical protein
MTVGNDLCEVKKERERGTEARLLLLSDTERVQSTYNNSVIVFEFAN